MKKLALILLAIVLLAGCNANKTSEEVKAKETKTEQVATPDQNEENTPSESVATVEGETFTIGINQFARHGSLDNCRIGFIEGLKKAGFEEGKNLNIDYQNADADTAFANQIAQSFAGAKVDMIAAIATPSAMSSYNAAISTEIPVVYTAISDPVIAGLAKEDKLPTGNITGTSDALPVKAQLEMIRKILPEAKTIGILYTTSEANSESTIKTYQSLVADYGFTLETVGVSTAADIPLATDNLLAKVDALSNLTDNTVVSSLPTILDKANAAKKPVFGSEIEQVKIGCLAAQGIDYLVLGEKTGEMAAKILKGESKASEMAFETITDPYLYVNNAVAEKLGITIAPDYLSTAKEAFDTITE